MDVLVLGTYVLNDVNILNEAAAAASLEIVWDFDDYNIEAKAGIRDLESYYKLLRTGVIVDAIHQDSTFSSYPLVCEISDYYVATEWEKRSAQTPRLFRFFDELQKKNLKKLIIAFANEWGPETSVKVEKLEIGELKKRLNSFYVWCFGYRSLSTNVEIRDDYHPLVIEVEGNSF